MGKLLQIIFLGLGVFLTTAARADMIVLESNFGNYQTGQVIPTGETLILQDGQSILLLNDAGDTVQLAGPESLKIGESLAQDKGEIFLATIGKILTRETDKNSEMGGIRGGHLDDATLPVNAILVGASGKYCMTENGEFWLYRADVSMDDQLSVMNVTQGKSVQLSFKRDEAKTAWKPMSSARYFLRLASSPLSASQVQMIMLPDGEIEDLVALINTGCHTQANRVLLQLMNNE